MAGIRDSGAAAATGISPQPDHATIATRERRLDVFAQCHSLDEGQVLNHRPQPDPVHSRRHVLSRVLFDSSGLTSQIVPHERPQPIARSHGAARTSATRTAAEKTRRRRTEASRVRVRICRLEAPGVRSLFTRRCARPQRRRAARQSPPRTGWRARRRTAASSRRMRLQAPSRASHTSSARLIRIASPVRWLRDARIECTTLLQRIGAEGSELWGLGLGRPPTARSLVRVHVRLVAVPLPSTQRERTLTSRQSCHRHRRPVLRLPRAITSRPVSRRRARAMIAPQNAPRRS